MAFNRCLRALSAFVIFAAPIIAPAQTIETTPFPIPPKPDFSSMQFLIGTWSCSTKSSRRPAPVTSSSTYKISTDGWWIDETTVANSAPWFPQKTTSYDKITYDSDTKRWVDVSYGDLGNYDLTTSPGWNGNAMVWHDPTFAPGADVKTVSDVTMTKQSASKYTMSSTFTEASGRSISVAGTCTKSS